MEESRMMKLIEINNISKQRFEDLIYSTLVMSVFETLCDVIIDNKLETEILNALRSTKNQIFVVRKLLDQYVGCILTDLEYQAIYDLLLSFFRKNNTRNKPSYEIRARLLEKQKYQCSICNRSITQGNSHMDHIIAWHYVGDTMDNNYQMLCVTCNEKKKKSSMYALKMLLVDKQRSQNHKVKLIG